MAETVENNEESEKQCLIVKNRMPDEETIRINNLHSFSSLIHRLLQSKERIDEQQLFTIFLQLIVLFTIYIPSIVIGGIYLNERNETKKLCIFLILQGVCGFFMVFVHLCVAIFDWTSSDTIRHFTVQHRRIIFYLFTFANYATIFRFIWFIMIHIWLFERNRSYDSNVGIETLHLSILMVVITEYIVRISFLCLQRCDCLLTLPWLEKKIQDRFKQNVDRENIKRSYECV